MIRSSGLYAVLDGTDHPVDVKAPDHVTVAGPHGPVRHDIDRLDDLLSVRTQATWRGGRIAVTDVRGDECGFVTNDGALAEREGLAGDFHNGWHGAAPVAELSDVSERVTSIHPRRREA